MKQLDLNKVDLPTEGKGRLPVGGYICRIERVQDVMEKEYLRIDFDIFDGDHKGRYADLFEKKAFWGGNFIRSYNDNSLPFFKAFLTAIENSNKGFEWKNNEMDLVGKMIGLVIGYEEYNKKDGTVGERTYVAQVRSVDSIRKGDFKLPELKKLKQKSSPMDGFSTDKTDIPGW